MTYWRARLSDSQMCCGLPSHNLNHLAIESRKKDITSQGINTFFFCSLTRSHDIHLGSSVWLVQHDALQWGVMRCVRVFVSCYRCLWVFKRAPLFFIQCLYFKWYQVFRVYVRAYFFSIRLLPQHIFSASVTAYSRSHRQPAHMHIN